MYTMYMYYCDLNQNQDVLILHFDHYEYQMCS